MRQAGPIIKESGSVEDLHHLRLMALLHELVREKGNRGAASVLGIDHRTVASCMKTGRLSWRVREALERGLQSGAGPAAAGQRERNEALEGRMGELEEKTRRDLEDARKAMKGEVDALREGHAKELRRLERRLAKVAVGKDATDAAPAAVKKPTVKPAWRPYRDLVTLEPEPGEEQVYGDATPLIVEWRKVRAEFLDAEDGLSRAIAEERMRELEIELIGGRELTLPPRTYPWDGSDRRDEVWRRTQALERARVERARAQIRRWIRRVLALGRWRD